MREKRWIVVVALCAALAAAMPASDATAKRKKVPKQSISALVSGHRIAFRKKGITTSREGDSVAFGGGDIPHHLNQIVKGLVIGCAVPLSANVFPVPGEFCAIGYAETKLSKKNPSTKQWATVEGIQVTFTSFEGTRLNGTFEGTIDPVDPNGGYGPVTIQDGKFSVVFTE